MQKLILWSRKEIEDELIEFAPDILHSHDSLSIGVFGLKTAHALQMPTVTTVHQLPWYVTAYLPEVPGLPGPVAAFARMRANLRSGERRLREDSG